MFFYNVFYIFFFLDGCFLDGCLFRWLLTLNKLKKLKTKLPWEKLDAYVFLFFWPLPHVTGTPPSLLRPVRVSTSSELYPNTWLFFFEASSFFIR